MDVGTVFDASLRHLRYRKKRKVSGRQIDRIILHVYVSVCKDTETNRQIDGQIEVHPTGFDMPHRRLDGNFQCIRQMDRQMERQKDRQIDRPTDLWTDK